MFPTQLAPGWDLQTKNEDARKGIVQATYRYKDRWYVNILRYQNAWVWEIGEDGRGVIRPTMTQRPRRYSNIAEAIIDALAAFRLVQRETEPEPQDYPNKPSHLRLIKSRKAQIISQDEEAVKLIEDEQDKMQEDEVPEVDMDMAVGRRFPEYADKVAQHGPLAHDAKFQVHDIVTISNRDPNHRFVIIKAIPLKQTDEWGYVLMPHKGGPNYQPHRFTGFLQPVQAIEHQLTKVHE